MITELAIQGRDAAELMKIMPGMGNAGGLNQQMFSSLTTQSNTGPIGTMSAQGTQLYGGMTMTADGASLLDPGNMGTQTANINQNQIQEVSLLTSAYGAEYAKGPIIFQAIGKSGSANYHGRLTSMPATGVQLDGLLLQCDQHAEAERLLLLSGRRFRRTGSAPVDQVQSQSRQAVLLCGVREHASESRGKHQFRFIPTSQMMGGNFSPAYLASLGPNFANGTFSNNAVVPCQNACYAITATKCDVPGRHDSADDDRSEFAGSV